MRAVTALALSLALAAPAAAFFPPLHEAARAGDTAAVTALLDAGADPNARISPRHGGDTAMHLAAENGHTAAVAALLDAGADPNATNQDGSTPLRIPVKVITDSGGKVISDSGAK